MNSDKPRKHWKDIHAHLVGLSKRRAELDYEEAQWLIEGEQAQLHLRLGYGSYVEYLGVVFGYQARVAQERLRVARRLAALPQVADSLRQGRLVWSGARELGRVATPETEEAWLDATCDKGVREIERMVAGLTRGDAPGDPKHAGKETHVLRFEVSGATLATWREAMKKIRAEHGGGLSEEEELLAVARLVLEGPKDAGRASYQVAVAVCDECGAGTQQGSGEPIAVGEADLEMAYCDAQFIGRVDVTHVGQSGHGERAKQTVAPARRRQVVARDHGQCVVDGCRASTFVDVHHLVWRTDGGQHDPDNLCVLCSAHHNAVHQGKLHIVGRPSTGLSFFHADGAPYGSPLVDAERVERNASEFHFFKERGLATDHAWRAVHQPPHP